MDILPVKTRTLIPPKDDLFAVLTESLPPLREGDIVCIASKVVAIHQGRAISSKRSVISDTHVKPKTKDLGLQDQSPIANRQSLILSEADWVDDPSDPKLTIKNGMFIPFAGVDESNGDGHYILWPEDPFGAAREIREFLLKKIPLTPFRKGGVQGGRKGGVKQEVKKGGVKNIGVIIVDSTCMPLRNGTVGMAIGFAGFDPVKDYVGEKDLFGRKMEFSRSNVADMLASAAVLTMGEGNESTPIAIVRHAPVRFSGQDFSAMVKIDPEEDIFAPLLDTVSSSEYPAFVRRYGLRTGKQVAGREQIFDVIEHWKLIRQLADEHSTKPVFTLIAVVSLDGVIAPDEKKLVDWASVEDQEWFAHILQEFDATVLGHTTFSLLPKVKPKRPRIVLISQERKTQESDEYTFFLNPRETDLKAFLRKRKWKNIGVTGGAQVYRYFAERNLADHLFLTIEPKVFGKGTRLFGEGTKLDNHFELVSHLTLNARGTLLCHYRRRGARRSA